MKEIKLTQGKVAFVDDEDYDFLTQWKWYYHNGYAKRHGPRPKRPMIYMHRVILERMGFTDFEECDHMNRDGIDNRKRNLRPATRQQNVCNRGRLRNNTSGYVGVAWHKDAEKWHARIMINGECLSLGLYENKEDAARAYNKAARKYHGEFAVLNEVLPV